MMAKEHHIIYLPGLGDHDSRLKNGQKALLKKWEKAGVTTHFQPINWADGELFEPKLQRVNTLIDELASKSHRISLVGVSAGASAAVNVYTQRKSEISGIVYICGKLMGSINIDPKYYRRNPAFRGSLSQAQINIKKLTREDKEQMLSLHPFFDEVVAIEDTKVPGVITKTIPFFFHAPTIFAVLSFYKRVPIDFLKNGHAGLSL
ncbi:MAG: hypothetical protein JWO96_745 [Candidatus Saccharibacteria bacterium]|nr:hypothetical protein [Candidatus Saccharibacteria bacterium]